jgi:hypothetical protein
MVFNDQFALHKSRAAHAKRRFEHRSVTSAVRFVAMGHLTYSITSSTRPNERATGRWFHLVSCSLASEQAKPFQLVTRHLANHRALGRSLWCLVVLSSYGSDARTYVR